ncbi:MAG: carbohydrate binding domain-containing protein [Roseiarcus sp.]|uniref:carbohydrate binding domain-containing protein n=1 Tax=Roseiarcus sp. TaxID=1969460 RepID=UPI003BB09CA0
MKLLTIFAAGALAFAASSATNANAANLVVNGGFETGDFTGWTTDPVSYPMYIVASPVYAGTYAAQIAGYSFGPDTLTQTIATTAGQEYTLSFWIYQQAIGPVTFFDVTWDGSTVVSMSYPASDSGDIP